MHSYICFLFCSYKCKDHHNQNKRNCRKLYEKQVIKLYIAKLHAKYTTKAFLKIVNK